MNHVIAYVRFPRKSNVGVLRCTCGEEMSSDEFNDHRANEGLKRGDRINAGAARYDNTPWRRLGAMSIKGAR